jgi:hypothetical protein
MLYIRTKQGGCIEWQVGEKLHVNFHDIEAVEVQADGTELIHIQNNFSNIPFHNSNSFQRWFGAMAQFIAHNL